MVPGEARRRGVAGTTQGGATEPSAGEREGTPLARKEPSAGEREGAALARKEPSAGEREGIPLASKLPGAKKCPTAGAFGFARGPAPLVDHATSVPGRWRSPDTFVPW